MSVIVCYVVKYFACFMQPLSVFKVGFMTFKLHYMIDTFITPWESTSYKYRLG